jgi:hypothetical protein
MSRNKQAEAERQQFWQMAIETYKASELSVRQFCRQEGLSEASFYYWQKKLAEAENIISEPFIEVSMPPEKTTGLELVLSSGNILRIGCGSDSQTLSDVISILRKADLC